MHARDGRRESMACSESVLPALASTAPDHVARLCRAGNRIRAASCQQLNSLISLGKQKAADGTAGSRGQQVQISDALREAAAAAAARATALARGRMEAREAAAAAASGAE